MVKSKILTKYREILHFFGSKVDSVNKKMYTQLDSIITAEQVHGNKISVLDKENINFIKGVDGIVTSQSLTLGIRTADCLPIFFYDPQKKIIAAIHAGWKGLYLGIIENAVGSMKKLGCKAVDIKVAVGPHIQVCCYDVPKDRLNKFGDTKHHSGHLDLGKIALHQLMSDGVKQSNIEISDICTSCNPKFWSFRRDRTQVGRMLNVIGKIPN